MKKSIKEKLMPDWHLIASACLSILFFGEFVGNSYLGSLYKGYDWKIDSISYLGQQNSPVLGYVQIWGTCFTLLYIFLGISYYLSFKNPSNLIKAVSILFLIYGLGEGLGSSFFPVHAKGEEMTQASLWHNIFGGLADSALYSIPVLMLFEYSGHKFRKFQWSTYFLMSIAIAACFVFLIAKYFNIHQGIFDYRGLWQRVFLLCFYLYFFLLLKQTPEQVKA